MSGTALRLLGTAATRYVPTPLEMKKFHCRFKKGQVVKLTFDGGDKHTGGGGSSSSVSSSAETACMVAVNRNYGGNVDDLPGFERRQGPGPERTVANGS